MEEFRKDQRIYLVIEPTLRCQSNCQICARQNITSPVRSHISDEIISKIIQDLKPRCRRSRIERIYLGGWGDPLSYSQVFELINLLHENLKAPLTINTNGLFLTDQQIRALLASKISSIVYSLNAVDQATYDSLMMRGRFYDAIEKLRLLLDHRKRSDLKPSITLQCMNPWNHNYDAHLREILSNLTKDHDRFIIRGIENISGLTSLKGYKFEKNTARAPCFYLWKTLVIGSDGGIYFCCSSSLIFREKADLYMGNISSSDVGEYIGFKFRKPFQLAHLEHNHAKIRECRNCNAPRFF